MIALTHVPSPRLHAGERSFIDHQAIDHALAARQHAEYCRALAECGWDVRTLTHHADLADSVFIEDTAVILDELAILASMGAASRRAEPAAMEPVLRELHILVKQIELPGTLEGGDVLRRGREVLIGLSRRTNAAAVEQFKELVEPWGYSVNAIEVSGALHLKTALCALPDGRLLVDPRRVPSHSLRRYKCVFIPPSEPFAANILLSGQTVILPAEHVQTIEMLSRDYDLRPVGISEFAKAEGGVTCLSLLIDT
jgi:dimethylargininase